MVAAKVRDLASYRKGVISNDIKAVANKNPALQKYIRWEKILFIFNVIMYLFHRELKVIDNQQILMQMSHSIEPNQRIRTSSTS